MLLEKLQINFTQPNACILDYANFQDAKAIMELFVDSPLMSHGVESWRNGYLAH